MIKSCWVIWDTIKYMQVQGSIDCKKYTDEKTAILNKYFTKKKLGYFMKILSQKSLNMLFQNVYIGTDFKMLQKKCDKDEIPQEVLKVK